MLLNRTWNGGLIPAVTIFAVIAFAVPASIASAQVAIANNHPEEAAELAGGPEIAADHQLKITVAMALHNRDQMEQLIADQQNPSSPMYHRWLTPGEFNDRFGPSADDLAVVEGWLTRAGFSVESASQSRREVVASAP